MLVWEPTIKKGESDPVRSAIFQAIGAATAVVPKGEFFSTEGFRIAEGLYKFIEFREIKKDFYWTEDDLEEFAWVLLANVSGGDWKKQSAEWQKTVIQWRELWHSKLRRERSDKVE
jgi:hypothetical protein